MFGAQKIGDEHELALTGLERAKLERDLQADRPLPSSPPTPVLTPPPSRPAATLPSQPPAPSTPSGNAAHVLAGPGVKLKGDITGCDTLRVEGIVDGTAVARQLIVCTGGSFLGTAEIEDAEIEGYYDGTLNVHGRLLLRSSGRIAGTLSYGQIEVERGGEIIGHIASYQKQEAPKPAANVQLVSVSSERRTSAASAGPAVAYQPPPSEPPVPRKDVAPVMAHSEAPTPQPVPQDVGEVQPKARKSLFFGRG
ncbi:MAG: polymer-forming cytoskeletal protein [Alphaproteobacteria bacterium]|nr:polymer-forming cytoskeletal protein [Alphaproteobacteria bacterium]